MCAPTRNAVRRALPYLLAFLVSTAVFCLVAAVRGVYPFGAESFLTEDLKYQYVDLFTWYRNVLTGGDSLLYSFSPSLGSNAWGLWSYYLASPLNLLILLFPANLLTLALFVISAIKQGLMGLTATFWLRRRFGLTGGTALALALCLPCSLWIFTQLRNPMWMDAMVLLPLLAHAAWRLSRRGTWGELVAVLVATIACCWYTGYMLVLLSVCLCWLEWFVAPGEGSSRVEGTRTIALVGGALCLTLLLGAWTLYPTVAAQLGSWTTTRTLALVAVSAVVFALGLALPAGRVPGRVVRGVARAIVPLAILCVIAFCARYVPTLLEEGAGALLARVTPFRLSNLISGFFIGTYQAIYSPQLYVGALPLTGSLFILLDSRLDRRLRAGAAALLALALASVTLTPLYVAWCGFRSPNGFHSRTAFLLVLASMWATATYLAQRPREGRAPLRAPLAVAAVAALSIPCSLVGPVHDVGATILGAFMLLACDALLALRPATFGRLAGLALPLIVLVDLTLNGCLAWAQLYTGYTQAYHDGYVAETARELDALRALDGDAYRVEKNYTRVGLAAWNEGFSQDYNRLASYLSGIGSSSTGLLEALGYSDPGQFSTTYRGPILPSDALLGVRYVFSRVPLAGLEAVELSGLPSGTLLYKNPDALSVGYAVSSEVMSAEIATSNENPIDPFEAQNRLASAVLGREVKLFTPLDSDLVQDAAGVRSWNVTIPAGTLAYSWLLTDGTGVDYLYELSDATTDDAAAWAQDTSFEGLAWDNTRFSHAIRTISDISEEPRRIDVTIRDTAGVAGTATEAIPDDVTRLFYGLDMNVYHELISELAAQQLEVIQWSNARLTGTVEFSGDKDGLLVSVPYDLGWTVTVDGERVEAEPACEGAMTFVPLSGAGTHELEMTYVSPMLVEGIAVTVVTAGTLAARTALRRRKDSPRSPRHF